MRVLITGAGGFTGRHLERLLRRDATLDLQLIGRTASARQGWYACDLSDAEGVRALIERLAPQKIFHLAGSFTNEHEADYRANVVTARNVLQAVLDLRMGSRVLLVGSAAEYGLVEPQENPVKESRDLKPVTVYGLTKAYQTQLMKYYHAVFGVDVVMARPFNLYGEGLSPRLFAGRVYQLIRDYREGKIPKMVFGNLQHERDYIAIDQAVAMYRAIMHGGEAGEVYNVGSGQPIRTFDLLAKILAENGLDPNVVEESPSEVPHEHDVKTLWADISKVTGLLARNG